MTCIVGIKHASYVYIGGDSRAVAGLSVANRKDKKVFISHDIAYGFTSSYRMGQILQYHTEEIVNNDLQQKDPFGFVVSCLIPHYREILKNHGYANIKENTEIGGTFLIAFDYSLFEICPDFQVAEVRENFVSVGCGANLALGSLDTTEGWITNNPRLRIRRAIKTAAKFSVGVDCKVNIVRV